MSQDKKGKKTLAFLLSQSKRIGTLELLLSTNAITLVASILVALGIGYNILILVLPGISIYFGVGGMIVLAKKRSQSLEVPVLTNGITLFASMMVAIGVGLASLGLLLVGFFGYLLVGGIIALTWIVAKR